MFDAIWSPGSNSNKVDVARDLSRAPGERWEPEGGSGQLAVHTALLHVSGKERGGVWGGDTAARAAEEWKTRGALTSVVLLLHELNLI